MTARVRFLPCLAALLLPVLTACASGGGAGDGESGLRQSIQPQTPARPYSAAVRAGDTYYFSGKIGSTGETRAMSSGATAAEVRNIMESFRELLRDVDLDFSDVVQATVYLAHIADYAEMNEAYGEYFPSDPPARETLAVKDLVGGARVEISFIAVRSR